MFEYTLSEKHINLSGAKARAFMICFPWKQEGLGVDGESI